MPRSPKTKRTANPAHLLPDGPILTWEQAADYLGVTVRWLKRAVLEKRITIIKMGGLVRFARVDLDAYIEKQRREAKR